MPKEIKDGAENMPENNEFEGGEELENNTELESDTEIE
jgi:hypothetical protein